MKAFVWLAGLALASHAGDNIPAGARYVSMGSSYAAGPGVGVPDPKSGACGRSMSNYARQVAQRSGLILADVACSGAVTDNIMLHGQHGFPPQIEAVTPDTRLVSILIGGNDIDYVGNLLRISCRDSGTAHCPIAGMTDVDGRLAALPASLDAMIAEVRRRAPYTRIVLVSYLPVVPIAGDARCRMLPLSLADMRQMRDIAARLEQAIGGAASRNRVDFISASRIGMGHDACSATPFMAGIRPQQNAGWPAPVPYHPNQAGMDAIASALETMIGS